MIQKTYLAITILSVLFGSLELTNKNLAVVPNLNLSYRGFSINEFTNLKKEKDEIEIQYVSFGQTQRTYARSSNH